MNKIKPLRVGITAVGSGIGQSIVHSCRLSSLPLYLVGYDASALAYGAYDCHEHHQVPSSTLPDYPLQLLDLCLKHGVELLIPGLDTDLPILAEHAPRFEEKGVKVLVGGLEFTRLFRDKRLWGRTLSEYCSHILSGFTPIEAAEAVRGGLIHFPLIAKPMGGSASSGIRIIKAEKDFEGLSPDYVVQPYALPREDDPLSATIRKAIEQSRLVQVAEISYQWLVSKDGEVLARMASRNRLKDGVPIEIVPIDDEPYWEVLSPLIPFLSEKGMRGPVNFQGRMTAEGPRFFEMNGRYTGITGLRAMMGFNEVDLGIRSFMDWPMPAASLRINHRRVGLRQVAERIVSVVEHRDLRAAAERQVPGWNPDMGRHVLVTGATGWLGRHLVNALLADTSIAQVHAMVRSAERAAAIWPKPEKRLLIWPVEKVDVHDARFADMDAVFHLAAERNMKDGAGHARSLEMTRQLVYAAARVHIPRFIFLSSQSVYGLSRPPPWPESLPVDPTNTYGMDKWAGEQFAAMLEEVSRASRAVSVRLGRLYGAADGLRWTELPHKFIREAMQGATLSISGGQQLFDLIHIQDAVRALMTLLNMAHGTWAPVYNISGCSPVSIVDIAQAAISAAARTGQKGARLDVKPSDEPPARYGMDCSLFTSQSGWKPVVTLDEAMDGLAEMVKSHLETGSTIAG